MCEAHSHISKTFVFFYCTPSVDLSALARKHDKAQMRLKISDVNMEIIQVKIGLVQNIVPKSSGTLVCSLSLFVKL